MLIDLKMIAIIITFGIAFIQALEKKKNLRNWLIILTLISSGTTMVIELVTFRDKSQKDQKLEKFLAENGGLKKEVLEVQKELGPFTKAAEKRYPDLSKKDALKRLQYDIEKIEARARILEEEATKSKRQISELQKKGDEAETKLIALKEYQSCPN